MALDAKRATSVDVGVYSMVATATLDVLGGTNVGPVLPIYLKQVGANAFQVNCISSVYALVGIPAAVYFGKLAERHGQKSALLIGLLGCIVFWALLGFCSSVLTMLIVRALLGIFAATQGVVIAYLMTFVPDETEREKIIGWQTKLIYLAAAAGAGIGSVLYGFGGWLGLCLVMAGIQFLELVVGFFFWKGKADEPCSRPEVKDEGESSNDAKEKDGRIARHYFSPQVGPYLLVNFFDQCCGQVFNAVIVFLVVDHYGYNEAEWMHLISIYCFLTLPFSLIAEAQIEWMGGYKPTVLFGNVCFISVVIFLCFGPRSYWSPFAFLVLTVFEAAQNMSGNLLLQNSIPAQDLNQVNSLVAAQSNLVTAVAAPMAGLLYDQKWYWPLIWVVIMATTSSCLLSIAPKHVPKTDPLLGGETLKIPKDISQHAPLPLRRMASVLPELAKFKGVADKCIDGDMVESARKLHARSERFRGVHRAVTADGDSDILAGVSPSPLTRAITSA